jgi:hypothetical protein
MKVKVNVATKQKMTMHDSDSAGECVRIRSWHERLGMFFVRKEKARTHRKENVLHAENEARAYGRLELGMRPVRRGCR